VVFSGGVDSSFLLKVAQPYWATRPSADRRLSHDASGRFGSLRETSHGRRLPAYYHRLRSCTPALIHYSVPRCFFCNDELYRYCRSEADQLGVTTSEDGSNLDDLKHHRPGLTAVKEWRIRHPLVEAQMAK